MAIKDEAAKKHTRLKRDIWQDKVPTPGMEYPLTDKKENYFKRSVDQLADSKTFPNFDANRDEPVGSPPPRPRTVTPRTVPKKSPLKKPKRASPNEA